MGHLGIAGRGLAIDIAADGGIQRGIVVQLAR